MPHVRPVDSEGRILLPAGVRDELGIEAGTKVTITLEDGEARIVPGDRTTSHDLQRRGHGSPVQVGGPKPDPPDDATGRSSDPDDVHVDDGDAPADEERSDQPDGEQASQQGGVRTVQEGDGRTAAGDDDPGADDRDADDRDADDRDADDPGADRRDADDPPTDEEAEVLADVERDDERDGE